MLEGETSENGSQIPSPITWGGFLREVLVKEPGRGPPAGEAGDRPEISVVVTAHERREYLLGAVSSVRGQNLPPGSVEILVVKNFTDEAIDRVLDREGVGHLETEETPLGSKIAEGVSRTRGPLVGFLEDDDEFAPGRLARIRKAFEGDPSLGYYRNGHRRVDAAGRELSPAARGAAYHHFEASGVRRISPTDLARAVPWLRRTDPDFNLSSMVVRREVLAPVLPSFRGREAAIDSSVFYAALSARVGLLFDPAPLTVYRVHGSNLSLWDGTTGTALQDRLRYQQRFLQSFRQILDEVARSGPTAAEQLAGSTYYGSRILYRVLTGEGGRSALGQDLRRLLGFTAAAPLTVRPDIPVWAAAALLAPDMARRAFVQRRARESRNGRR